MKTRLKNRIVGFSREQLIDWICLSCVDIRSTHSPEDAQDIINDIREAIEIGFPAALTAQPVKLPDCDFAAVYHMSGGSEDYCYGFVDGTQNAIMAIRAAGYEVQE